MALDEQLMLALLQRRLDPYLVGYRWDCSSPYNALRIRRRVVQLAEKYPSLILVSVLSLDATNYPRDEEFNVAVEGLRRSLEPIPEAVKISFINRGDDVSVVVFAHHLFADGTAFWNLASGIFGEGRDFLQKTAEPSCAEKEVLKRVRSRLAGVAPSAVPLEMHYPSLKITEALLDSITDSLLRTGFFEKLVSPRRTDDDGGRIWGSKVEYETLFDNKVSEVSNGSGKMIGALSADLFAAGEGIPGLISKGVCSFSRRTDCDVLVEQLGDAARILITCRDKPTEIEIYHSIEHALEGLNG